MNAFIGRFNAADLMRHTFPPVQWVVPGIIPQGMTLLAAAPKVGKSWLVLGLALAIAEGGQALGALDVTPRPVLYLALEDGPSRLQYRLGQLGVGDDPPPELEFLTKPGPAGAVAAIEEYLAETGHLSPVVILDTFGRARPASAPNANQYQLDYAHAARLKTTVDAYPGSALIVVHHTRKGAAEDFLDAVSGTQGLAGAADTVAVLKRDRESLDAVLHVTSRDAREGSYALQLDEGGRWTLAGSSLAEAQTAAEAIEAKLGKGQSMGRIVDALAELARDVKPLELAEHLGMPPATVRQYLLRLADDGRIKKVSRGVYRAYGASSCAVCGEPLDAINAEAGTHPGCEAA